MNQLIKTLLCLIAALPAAYAGIDIGLAWNGSTMNTKGIFQNYGTIGTYSIQIETESAYGWGYSSGAGGGRAIAIGSKNWGYGDDSITIGQQNSAIDPRSLAFGFRNQIDSDGWGSAPGYVFDEYLWTPGDPSTMQSTTLAIGSYNYIGYGGFMNQGAGPTLGSIAVGIGNTITASGASVFGSHITNITDDSTMIGPSDAAKVIIQSDGNVGIGIANTGSWASQKLEVGGNIRMSGSLMKAGGGTLTLPASGTLTLPSGGGTLVSNTGSQTITGATTVVTLGGSTASTQTKIDGITGNVGIGTASPAGRFHVMQDVTPTTFDRNGTGQKVTITTDASSNRIQADSITGGTKDFELISSGTSPGPIGLNPAGVRAVTIATNGSVGIGTTNPGNRLHIVDSNVGGSVRIQNSNIGGYASLELYDNSNVSAASIGYANPSATFLPGTLMIGTRNTTSSVNIIAGASTPTPRLTVLPTGNIGIGTTTPAAKLDVNGTVQIAGDVKVKNNAIIRISAAGDIGMGGFTSGINPAN